MRIHLKISKNINIVNFNHLPLLVGVFHKWLGHNSLHNDLSLYSFSWLQGAKSNSKGIDFPNGATWFISAHENSIINKIISGIKDDPQMFSGMYVEEIVIQQTPEFEKVKRFIVGSPILVKCNSNNHQQHLSFSDPKADEIIYNTLISKLKKAQLPLNNLKILFDRSFVNAKMKKVNYNGIGNKANICPIIIEGLPEQIAFAWNVGIGNSTGIGFGSLI